MSILDRRAWWLPAWLDRTIPDLEREGGEPAAGPPGPEPVRAREEATVPVADGPSTVDEPPSEQPPAVPTA